MSEIKSEDLQYEIIGRDVDDNTIVWRSGLLCEGEATKRLADIKCHMTRDNYKIIKLISIKESL